MVSAYIVLIVVVLLGTSICQNTKLLAVIAAYRSVNNVYLLKVLENYVAVCESGYDIRVVVQTVDIWERDQIEHLRNAHICSNSSNNLVLDIESYDENVKLHLTEKHRYTIMQHLSDYDVFIYQEDDIGITVDHINLFLLHTSRLEAFAIS